MDLKQTRTVQNYYEKFEGFYNLLQLTKEDVFQIFINNLNPNISKPITSFYPKTMANALKLAKFYELPKNHYPPNEDLNNTPTVQLIIPPSPKQFKAVNPYFLLNTLKPSIYEEIHESKFDKSSLKYLAVGSLLLKNLQPNVAGYKFGFVSAYEKHELIYSVVFVIENKLVDVNDPCGFRLLLMGKRSNNVAATTSSSSGGLFSWLIGNQFESIPPFDFPLPAIFEMEVFGLNGLQNDEKA